MTKLDIRLAQFDDRQDLIDLQRRASLAGYDHDVVRQLRERPELIDLDAEMIARNQVFIAEEHGRIVGFATIITHEGDDAELEGIFVEPSEWRRGIGRRLVQAIEREAEAWGANRLHVIANPDATAFYEALGFTAIGRRKMLLGPEAPLMVKPVAIP